MYVDLGIYGPSNLKDYKVKLPHKFYLLARGFNKIVLPTKVV